MLFNFIGWYERLADRLEGWQPDKLLGWEAKSQIDKWTGKLVYWHTIRLNMETWRPVDWKTERMVDKKNGVLVCQQTGMLMGRQAGRLVCW